MMSTQNKQGQTNTAGLDKNQALLAISSFSKYEEKLYRGLQVALIIPCYNEEQTIGNVISEFRAEMPLLSKVKQTL